MMFCDIVYIQSSSMVPPTEIATKENIRWLMIQNKLKFHFQQCICANICQEKSWEKVCVWETISWHA